MSRINRANAQLQAQVMRDLIGSSCDLGLSGKLQLAAAELTATGGLQRTIAVLQEPGIAELAAEIGQGVRLESVLATASPTATLNEVTAQLLTDMDDHLGRLQQTAVASLAEQVLRIRAGPSSSKRARSLRASRRTAATRHSSSRSWTTAELLVDQLAAGDCAGNLAAFMSGMEEAGAPLTHVAELEHDPNKAPLIAQAAAAGEANLAAGIARHATRGLASRPAPWR